MEDIVWRYETRKLDELEENKDNPRRMSKKRAEELKESLKSFGVCQPIVVQPSGEIIGGHQRLRTLRSLGYREVFVAVPSRALSQEEFQELTIRLNKITGDFDDDMLANRWDLDILLRSGFTKEELHFEIEPKQKPKSLSINIKFETEDDLRSVEKQLNTILCDFPLATMKVRCK